ncbi:YkgJ family cysteine cluster protein [Desulfobacterales bacterium HSG16]|nr:YkgJ family cysteine cluster protein [Desulfobacterales bacterium HSG16]
MLYINNRLLVLDRILKIYDGFMAQQDIACSKGCAACCTRNVTTTTLEGYRLMEYMISMGSNEELMAKIENESDRPRFVPTLTTNRLAELCMQGEQVPEEKNDAAWGECPMLKDNQCPVYSARPFGCRCMVSVSDCRGQSAASMPDFLLTVNEVFLQYIEHIDPSGKSGNLTDILIYMSNPDKRNQYLAGNIEDGSSENTLISNHPVKMLMIPPEHRERIAPLIESLNRI